MLRERDSLKLINKGITSIKACIPTTIHNTPASLHASSMEIKSTGSPGFERDLAKRTYQQPKILKTKAGIRNTRSRIEISSSDSEQSKSKVFNTTNSKEVPTLLKEDTNHSTLTPQEILSNGSPSRRQFLRPKTFKGPSLVGDSQDCQDQKTEIEPSQRKLVKEPFKRTSTISLSRRCIAPERQHEDAKPLSNNLNKTLSVQEATKDSGLSPFRRLGTFNSKSPALSNTNYPRATLTLSRYLSTSHKQPQQDKPHPIKPNLIKVLEQSKSLPTDIDHVIIA